MTLLPKSEWVIRLVWDRHRSSFLGRTNRLHKKDFPAPCPAMPEKVDEVRPQTATRMIGGFLAAVAMPERRKGERGRREGEERGRGERERREGEERGGGERQRREAEGGGGQGRLCWAARELISDKQLLSKEQTQHRKITAAEGGQFMHSCSRWLSIIFNTQALQGVGSLGSGETATEMFSSARRKNNARIRTQTYKHTHTLHHIPCTQQLAGQRQQVERTW